MRVLQAYVDDLCEQNEVLVQTVDELEREANERVVALESRLRKSSLSGKVSEAWPYIILCFVRFIILICVC